MNSIGSLFRTKAYSFIEANNLCDEFKDKIVRVVNAENFTRPTSRFITSLIRAHLKFSSPETIPENAGEEEQEELSDQENKNKIKVADEISTLSFTESKKKLLELIRDHQDDFKIFQQHEKQLLHGKPQKNQPFLLPDINNPNPNSFHTLKDQKIKGKLDSGKPGHPQLFLTTLSLPKIDAKVQEKVKLKNKVHSKANGIGNFQSSQEKIDQVFFKIKSKNLPIIWIYGYKQSIIARNRTHCCKFLAKFFDFTYIQMDDEILKWHRYYLKDYWDQSNEPVEDLHDLIFHRAKRIIRKVIPNLKAQSKEAFLSTVESCQLIKFAMILAMPTNGFIIDNFPNSIKEANTFEKELYPSLIGMCFTSALSQHQNQNQNGNKNKNRKLDIQLPKYFVRDPSGGSENDVNALCHEFRRKTIKIINVEDLNETGMEEICGMVSRHLREAKRALKLQELQKQRSSSVHMNHSPHPNTNNNNSTKYQGQSPNNNMKSVQDKYTQPEIIVIKHVSLPNNLNVAHNTAPAHSSLINGKNIVSKNRKNDQTLNQNQDQSGPVPRNDKDATNKTYSTAWKNWEHLNGMTLKKVNDNSAPLKTSNRERRRSRIRKIDVGVNVNNVVEYKKKSVKTKAVMTEEQIKAQIDKNLKKSKKKQHVSVVKLWEGNFREKHLLGHFNSEVDTHGIMQAKKSKRKRTKSKDTNEEDQDLDPETSFYLGDDTDDSSDAENYNDSNPNLQTRQTESVPGRRKYLNGQGNNNNSNKVNIRRVQSHGAKEWSLSDFYYVIKNSDEVQKVGGKENYQNQLGHDVIVYSQDNDNVTQEFSTHGVDKEVHEKPKNQNEMLPDISMPTIYETANSSEDDFDDDDDDDDETSNNRSSKTSTVQGVVFGPHGIISAPDSRTRAIVVSEQVSPIQIAINKLKAPKADLVDATTMTAEPMNANMEKQTEDKMNDEQAQKPLESGSRKRNAAGKLWSGLVSRFRRSTKH